VVVWLVVKRSVSTLVVKTVGLRVTVDVTVLVAGVTVTCRKDEQSATPFLVTTADAMTARAGTWCQRAFLIMHLIPGCSYCAYL
jgi:hypothetical protein